MAGCELNIAHAFCASPPAHRLRHDVMVTSADDFDHASRRRHQCVDGDDDSEADRGGGVISHYRLVPSSFGPGGSEWVTLSKSVLLQLVERICQLSFQTDGLSAAAASAAACSSAQPERFESSPAATLTDDPVHSADAPSSVVEPEQPAGRVSPLIAVASSNDVVVAASTPADVVVDVFNAETIDELAAANDGSRQCEVVPAASITESDNPGVMTEPVEEKLGADDRTMREVNCNNDDDDDCEVFTAGAAPMHEQDDKTIDDDLTTLAADVVAPLEDSLVSDDAAPAAASAPCKRPSTTTSTTSLRTTHDRRRRLRELRRLRRHRHRHHHQSDDEQSLDLHERCSRGGRIARRHQRFAVPRQPPPPPRFHDERSFDATGTSSAETSAASMRLPAVTGRCCAGRLSQPWSALNKVVVCQLVDVVLSQELTPITTTWRASTAASRDKRRSSGTTIWNPAMSPETRQCRTPTPPTQLSPPPPTLKDLTSLTEHSTSTLLHSLLSPTMAAAAAAAKTLLGRRRSDMEDAEVGGGGGSLSWTMPHQSSSSRRRHHSAAAPDTFRAPWTPPPHHAPPPPSQSFFWYNVPPSQGSFFLLPTLPDAAAGRPVGCYGWIGPTQTPAALPPLPVTADACPLDYCTRTLDVAGTYPNQEVRESAAVTGRHHTCSNVLSRRGDDQSSTPPVSRRPSAARLKWVVVNKTDVCSLFESLASSMVVDGEEKPMSDDDCTPPTTEPEITGTEPGSHAVSASAAAGEPMKWKSTLLRRAQAEAQTPLKHSAGDDAGIDVENTNPSFV